MLTYSNIRSSTRAAKAATVNPCHQLGNSEPWFGDAETLAERRMR